MDFVGYTPDIIPDLGPQISCTVAKGPISFSCTVANCPICEPAFEPEEPPMPLNMPAYHDEWTYQAPTAASPTPSDPPEGGWVPDSWKTAAGPPEKAPGAFLMDVWLAGWRCWVDSWRFWAFLPT